MLVLLLVTCMRAVLSSVSAQGKICTFAVITRSCLQVQRLLADGGLDGIHRHFFLGDFKQTALEAR